MRVGTADTRSRRCRVSLHSLVTHQSAVLYTVSHGGLDCSSSVSGSSLFGLGLPYLSISTH
jgi:hypothetical protein